MLNIGEGMKIIDKKAYDYWLINLKELKINKKIELVNFFSDAKNLYFTSINEIEKTNILTKDEMDYFALCKNRIDVETPYEELKSKNINLVVFNEDNFPRRLRNIPDMPYAIFYIGKLPDDNKPSIAIVGSRNCSEYGKIYTKKFAKQLSLAGIQIISGMAYGIDSIAQKEAINCGGYTAAVLGTSVDVCYPPHHIDLYNSIKEKGCLISEYPLGEKGLKWHFPMRNRIISAFSDVVLIVEARRRSGSLISADRALEQGKDVMAIPGRLSDNLSAGCNELIQQGARMILSVNDILDFYNGKYQLFIDTKNESNIKKDYIGLETDEKMVYSNICFDDVSLDELIQKTKLPIYRVISVCTKLSLKGLITEVGKGRFVRVI